MSEIRVIDEWDGGFGWLMDPAESMERASHALRSDDGWWLIDPVDGAGVDELVEDEGVAGIVVTLDRHKRDAAVFGERYDVPISLPEPLYTAASSLDHPVTDANGFIESTGWEIVPVIDRRGWHEVALASADAVYVSEALGTASNFCAPGEALGVHPLLRFLPPREVLHEIKADRVLVGHGEGIMEDGVAAMTAALRDARRNAPRTYWKALRSTF